ncbi:MAG: cupin domain-containing protein, partial [Deltaproteobacteria bacterium]|nr:cupin domain-containing protein [Deltaproteobacteria bacterium]
YHVVAGSGVFLLENEEIAMEPGVMLVAPEGVPHGIRNTGSERLVVIAILTPAPG